MNETYVEFYGKNKISPVTQDIADLEKHFRRRDALYRHLGITRSAIRGKKVLEVGPGSGFNSIHTAHLQPAIFHLVDANDTGIAKTRELFKEHADLASNLILNHTLLENYRPDIKFDFVLCEGMLPGMPMPTETLNLLANLVDTDGILVITCVDHISIISEMIRRIFAAILTKDLISLEARVDILEPVFTKHLNTLVGMNRPHREWIIDQMLNPAAINQFFSIPDAIEALKDQFDVYRSSPDFSTDWRWYKAIVEDDATANELFEAQYWSNVHSFLDHKQIFPARGISENKALMLACKKICDTLIEYEKNKLPDLLATMRSAIQTAVKNIKSFSPRLAEAFAETEQILGKPVIDPLLIANLSKFGSIFGRGQQYLSLTRKVALNRP